MSMNINKLLEEICKPGSIYDEIINNLITPRFDLKPELISEIGISFCENKEKIEKIYEEGYFKYYFIMTVKNQIHSSTSPFHKNVRLKDYEFIDNYETLEFEDEIEYKVTREENINLIEEAFLNVKKTWFQEVLYNEYFYKNKTYKQIANEYEINQTTIWLNVKDVRDKINEYIKNKKK